MNGKSDTVGYRFTDVDPFEVSAYPTAKESDHDGLIIVRHPLGQTQTYGPPEGADDFWDKDPEEIRDIAIRTYVNCIDWEDSDLMAAGRIADDAEDLDIDLDGEGDG